MDKTNIILEVTRFYPGKDSKPWLQTYSIPYREDWVVLDALNYIKDEIDGTLSYRWACRMGVCGSCGMRINRELRLSCAAFLREYHPRKIRVEPLPHFPLIRDLVVDISDFLDKLESVKPWIIRNDEKPVDEGEYLQTPQELEAYRQFSQCINCALCYSACPVYGNDVDFLGPATIALGHRYNLDSRDEGIEARRFVMEDRTGIWECTFVGECTRVCPKDVDPAAAIQRSKLEATKHRIKSLILPRTR